MDGMNMISCCEYSSPLGTLLLAASEHGLCGLYFEKHKYFKGPQGWERDHGHAHLQAAIAQLDEYFAHRRTTFDLQLDLRGTEFQQAVWRELLLLPFGSVSSYQAIAQRAGTPKAIRAAGTAIGRNPVSIIVPCHRVLGASGALSGYAGGIESKLYLLEFERQSSVNASKKQHCPIGKR